MPTLKDLSERMDKFEGSVTKILDILETRPSSLLVTPAPQTEEDKKIVAAGPNKYTTNPEWEAVALEILGDYLDHTEVEHEKTGGIKFTVVIKKEKSNAPAEYLAGSKADRRTREVSAGGFDAVTEWCKLIRSNLKRSEHN